MKYKSKIDPYFHGIVAVSVLLLALCAYNGFAKGQALYSLAFFIMLIFLGVFILPMYFNTYYLFTDDCLVLRCGITTKISVPYENIVSCSPGRIQANSLSLSKDTLIITYITPKGRKDVLISPKEQFDFMTQLKMFTKKQ